MKVLALNLNHRTRPKAISFSLLEAICVCDPDILVFNEYVTEAEPGDLQRKLSNVGFSEIAVSDAVQYRPGRWHNQLLIASRDTIQSASSPVDGPDWMSRTNTLTVCTYGLHITGLRVPAYTRAHDWYPYWVWLGDVLKGDLVIGDFNADPSRPRKWDRVLDKLTSEHEWSRPKIEESWSYKGGNRTTSKVDHVLVRKTIAVDSATYIQKPFVPAFTDHAALLVEIS